MMGSKKSESERETTKTRQTRFLKLRLPFLSLPLSHTPPRPIQKTKTKRKLHRAANAVRAAREKERLAARKARATES